MFTNVASKILAIYGSAKKKTHFKPFKMKVKKLMNRCQ